MLFLNALKEIFYTQKTYFRFLVYAMKNRKLFLYFLLFQFLFWGLLSYFPVQIERDYSTGLYPIWASFLRTLLGWIPFSVGDVGYSIVLLLLLKWCFTTFKNKSWKLAFWQGIKVFSIGYFVFYLVWGLNYSREPLYSKLALNREYTPKQLYDFTKYLLCKTNALQLQITNNPHQKVRLPFSKAEALQSPLLGYAALPTAIAPKNYKQTSIKRSLFSTPLSYMGFGGYLNPFTLEAQVNTNGPGYVLPMTAAHEMAHQLGYASESECNFIGFLAASKHPDPVVNYSAYTLALRYCLGEWSERDPKLAKLFIGKLNPGVLKNFQESETYWAQYETPIETGFKWFYDSYLKYNQQEEGLESYSKFIDLLIHYQLQQKGNF